MDQSPAVSERVAREGWTRQAKQVDTTQLAGARCQGFAQNWAAQVMHFDLQQGLSSRCFAWDRMPGLSLGLSGGEGHHPGLRRRSAPGQTLTFWPGGPNRVLADGPIRFLAITLPGPLFDRAAGMDGLPDLRGRLREDLFFFADARLEGLIRDFANRAFSVTEPPSALEMEARALLLVDHVIRLHGHAPVVTRRGGLAPQQLRRVQDFLQDHLTQDVSLSDAAAVAGLSTSYFARAFRESTGVPPHQWMIRQRVEQAKGLLELSALPLAEVALRSGFADQSHFTSAFRRATGTTPRQWRRNQTV
jgi:AraC family transcriptional regulator